MHQLQGHVFTKALLQQSPLVLNWQPGIYQATRFTWIYNGNQPLYRSTVVDLYNGYNTGVYVW